MLAIAATTTFVACKKDEVKSSQQKSKVTNTLLKSYKSVVPLFGTINIEVSWKDGCYHYSESGNVITGQYNRSVWCTPGCSFCMVTGSVIVKVGMVTGDGNGTPYGLNVPYSSNPSDYNGFVSLVDNKLVFSIDATKVSPEILQAKFSGNSIDLSSGFAIDENTFNALGIDRNHQFIPAGSYPLYEDGNIIYWEYALQ